jgi:hypothetical protein
MNVTTTLEVRHCQFVFDKPVEGIWASDLFGVMAVLTISNGRPNAKE